MWFKDDQALALVPLLPPAPLPLTGGNTERRLAATYNRLGGLLSALATAAKIPVEAALAVWQAESGGETYRPGYPVLRFENHAFFKRWGKDQPALFDQHFQFGGRGGVPGEKWKNHKWRAQPVDPWHRFHGDQDREYEVFRHAEALAGSEAACRSASFGGPQILGSNYLEVGYQSAADLFAAVSRSERAEVFSFFDFCQSKKILDEIRDEEWEDFAHDYNGPGKAVEYGEIIGQYYEAALALAIPNIVPGAPMPIGPAFAAVPPVHAPALGVAPAGVDAVYLADFVAFVAGLGLKHFKPYELLTMGHQHTDRDSPAFGLNEPPPRGLWGNIERTVKVLDELRNILGATIVLSSAYRSPAYNRMIAGAGASQHMQFNALDFSVRSSSSPADWAAALKQMRANKRFHGGIGVYSTFVHLDTRGMDADW